MSPIWILMVDSKLPSVLPEMVPSFLGPVLVVLDPDLMAMDATGEFNKVARTITIQDELTEESSWATFWHETTHLILSDSGLSNILSGEHNEAVCEAVGVYMTMAMQKGFLQVANKDTK